MNVIEKSMSKCTDVDESYNRYDCLLKKNSDDNANDYLEGKIVSQKYEVV